MISSVLCDDLEGWDREGGRGPQEGGDMGIYVYITDSLYCTAESNIPFVKQLYFNKDIFFKKTPKYCGLEEWLLIFPEKIKYNII